MGKLINYFFIVTLNQYALAAEESGSAVSDQDVKELLNGISKIPSLGYYGIIAAIVLALVMFIGWYWMKGIAAKNTEKENQKESAGEQADTVKKDQEVTNGWDKADQDSNQSASGGNEDKPDVPPEGQ